MEKQNGKILLAQEAKQLFLFLSIVCLDFLNPSFEWMALSPSRAWTCLILSSAVMTVVGYMLSCDPAEYNPKRTSLSLLTALKSNILILFIFNAASRTQLVASSGVFKLLLQPHLCTLCTIRFRVDVQCCIFYLLL